MLSLGGRRTRDLRPPRVLSTHNPNMYSTQLPNARLKLRAALAKTFFLAFYITRRRASISAATFRSWSVSGTCGGVLPRGRSEHAFTSKQVPGGAARGSLQHRASAPHAGSQSFEGEKGVGGGKGGGGGCR
eukprot:5783743-Prymnesium_polylepis.1